MCTFCKQRILGKKGGKADLRFHRAVWEAVLGENRVSQVPSGKGDSLSRGGKSHEGNVSRKILLSRRGGKGYLMSAAGKGESGARRGGR